MPATRRTQAERTAKTRQALIEATIRLLHKYGYAGTTTTLVPAEAGVSRGAFLHQFGTRADLMIAVVRSVYEEEVAAYTREFAKFETVRLCDLPEVIWDVLSRPAGMAVLEILNGSRNDPELAERLLPIQREIEANSLDNLLQRLAADGTAPTGLGRANALALIRLLVWSARGLSIMVGMGTPAEDLRESVEILRDLFKNVEGTEFLLPRPGDES